MSDDIDQFIGTPMHIDYREHDAAFKAEFGDYLALRSMPIYGRFEILVRGKWYPMQLSDLVLMKGPKEFVESVKQLISQHEGVLA